MSQLQFVIGVKEEIPAKYLKELMELFQKNQEEIYNEKPPTIEYFRRFWCVPLSSGQKRLWVIATTKEEKIVGYGYLSWNVKYDNLDQGHIWVYIKKSERRKGYGKRVLKELVGYIPPQVKIILLEAFGETDGSYFLNSLGKEKSYIEVLSVSDLTTFNREKVKQEAENQRKKALEKGYELIYVENLEHVFHLDFPAFVKMVEKIWNDMPREELSFEDEVVTIKRYQEFIQRQMVLGDCSMFFVAIHKKTSKPVGLTNTSVNKFQPELAKQGDTGVLRPHRGNGLGLALKYQMLEKLLMDTKVERWLTGNAGSNEHMLRINRILKHEPSRKTFLYEFSREELLAKFND
ncbi:MAG: GNAT family N-acetyltransferase [Candidatus Heimdallarchaeota archaeon]|nr:GNAT family N-acetyltransferase [Candidatus Heimdallarchaeota archaeon]